MDIPIQEAEGSCELANSPCVLNWAAHSERGFVCRSLCFGTLGNVSWGSVSEEGPR